jgi:hypothetical protein
VVVPRVLGQAVELHPLVVLTGVLIGATAFGILGALLASPTIASIIAIVRYLYRKITNKAPFLEQELTPASIKPLVPEKIHVLWNRMRTNLVSRIKSVKSRRKEDQATNPLPEEERRPMQNVKDQDRKQS